MRHGHTALMILHHWDAALALTVCVAEIFIHEAAARWVVGIALLLGVFFAYLFRRFADKQAPVIVHLNGR